MTVLLSLIGAAWAESPELIIAVPVPEEEEAKPRPGPAPVPINPTKRVRQSVARDVERTVSGTPPDNLFGRYTVVEFTEGGLTDRFVGKMARVARALDDDCTTIRMDFDFGQQPPEDVTGHRPAVVTVAQTRRCDKGGLGVYAEELAYEVPVGWMEGDEYLTLRLPALTVISDYVRLRRPADGDMRTPPQWLAPENRIERDPTEFHILAEPARRGALPVLHLIKGGRVLHLEAAPEDSLFMDAAAQ